jgi:putative ABC transport system permease protein
MIERIGQDLRFAVRSLLRDRGVTTIALVSLAIGIAANATVFSLVQAVEFPTLIYPNRSRIVFVESNNTARSLTGMPVSAPDADDIAAASRTLALASLAADQSSIVRAGNTARRVPGRRVTPAFFEILGSSPAMGRVLTADDGPEAIVLGDDLWRTTFAADADILGRAIRLDGGMVTVVGVMPPRFDADADFWVRLPPAFASRYSRDDRQFSLFARLSPQASLADAELELRDISRRLAADHPATNKDWTTVVFPLSRLHGRDSREAFILLQAAVGFVLLIACANIANILLARGTRRRHEMAVRASLGASRGRLVAGLLTESFLLSLTGGALGVVLSMWGIRMARALGGFPAVIDPTLNGFVLGFAALLSMMTGVLCGIVPALRASRVATDAVLREDARGFAGPSRGRLRAGLVAAQIACALVLATCGTLMLRTLVNRQQVDLGFDPRGSVRAQLTLAGDRYRDLRVVRASVSGLLDRLSQLPGVVGAGAFTWALPTAAGAQRHLTLPAERDTALGLSVRRGIEAVTPGYFDAIGTPIERGRDFTDGDRDGAAPVALINEELARQLWPNRNPVGHSLRLGLPGEAVPTVTVVGVVGTIRRSVMHDVPVARVYVPFAQHPNQTVTIVVRSRGDVNAAGRGLQAAVAATDPTLFAEGLRTVDADLAQFVAPVRLMTSLLTGFGLAGLLLAGLGVFGTMSYTVSQRAREMAVRSALGAHRRDIFRLVFTGALGITLVGIVAGIAIAAIATKALAGFLFAVSPLDPLTIAGVVAFLIVVSLAACYRPARAAAGADPMSILRG